MNPTQTSSLPARSTAPWYVAKIILRHKAALRLAGVSRRRRQGLDGDGKFHLASIVHAGPRQQRGLLGAEEVRIPLSSMEGCPLGSASRTRPCLHIVFLHQTPAHPPAARQEAEMQAARRQEGGCSLALDVHLQWCPSSAGAMDPRPRAVPQPEGKAGGIAEPLQCWPCRPQLGSIPLCSAGPGCSVGLGWRDGGWESSSAAPGDSPSQNIPRPRTSSPRAQGANAGPVSPAGTSGRWARG